MRQKISDDDERSIIGGRETDPESIETLDEEEVNVDIECLPENDRHKLEAQHIKDCNELNKKGATEFWKDNLTKF